MLECKINEYLERHLLFNVRVFKITMYIFNSTHKKKKKLLEYFRYQMRSLKQTNHLEERENLVSTIHVVSKYAMHYTIIHILFFFLMINSSVIFACVKNHKIYEKKKHRDLEGLHGLIKK